MCIARTRFLVFVSLHLLCTFLVCRLLTDRISGILMNARAVEDPEATYKPSSEQHQKKTTFLSTRSLYYRQLSPHSIPQPHAAQPPSLAMSATSTSPLPSTTLPNYDISSRNISDASHELVQLLGSEGVTSDLHERRGHSITQWSPASPSQIPALVVRPASTADVSTIMTLCSRRRIPVTAYCGGTSMPGALASTRGGICVDFNRMNKILALHKEDMDAVVQPAVEWQDLNDHLGSHGLFFPPDPSPGAKIGGMVCLL